MLLASSVYELPNLKSELSLVHRARLGTEYTLVPFVLLCSPAWTCRSVFVPQAFEAVMSNLYTDRTIKL